MQWLAVLVAPFVGSFLGVLVRRLPRGEPVGWTRSACETCARPLGAGDLLPIVSFLALRGRCRTCRAPIGGFHLAIELAAVGVALAAVALTPESQRVWTGCVLGWWLLALAWIDAEHMLLPDALTLPLILAGLGVAWLDDPVTVPDHALGAAAGYAAFRVVGAVYARLRGRDGLGEGDAKLLAAGGAWVGWQPLADLVLMAALSALAVGLGVALYRRRFQRDRALPFGPFLAVALWLIWVWQAWSSMLADRSG